MKSRREREELPGMRSLLIIGYGSLLRGDDAVGVHVARILARRGYHALAAHQLTPELAEQMAQARAVVFVDADAGLGAGEVVVARIEAAAGRAGVMEHHSTAERLLDLTRELYAATPEAWRVGIGGEEFGVGRRLSPGAKSGVRRAIAEMIRRLPPDSPRSGPGC
jgi:hydrogenase maturation protease